MKITFDDKYDFTPAAAGNKEDAAPVVFHCRYLSSPERARCIDKKVIVQGDATRVELKYDEKSLVELSVESIENLEVNGIKVRTAQEFLAQKGLARFFDELVNEAVSRNSRQDLKNS